jgi:hypothetical protein
LNMSASPWSGPEIYTQPLLQPGSGRGPADDFSLDFIW